MYEVNLKESLFPEQSDAELLNISIGALLRSIAAIYPCREAVVEADEDGDRALSLTCQEVLETSERLAVALGTRFVRGERIVVWAPNIIFCFGLVLPSIAELHKFISGTINGVTFVGFVTGIR